MFGGVHHKNVTQRIRIGHGLGIVRARGCAWEGSHDYRRSDRDRAGIDAVTNHVNVTVVTLNVLLTY